MSTPIYAYTVNFTIVLDRAGHLVVEQMDETTRATIRGIDFGHSSEVTALLLTWLESEHRDEMGAAIDAYLTAEFAKRPAGRPDTEVDRRIRNAIEHADGLEIRPEHNVTRDQLRRYGVIQSLSGAKIRDLSDALTVRETAAERAQLGRPLRKMDLIQLLVRKHLGEKS